MLEKTEEQILPGSFWKERSPAHTLVLAPRDSRQTSDLQNCDDKRVVLSP